MEKPKLIQGVMRQYTYTEIFGEDYNIRQLEYSSFFTINGKVKDQNTWSINSSALNDSASIGNLQLKNMENELKKPVSDVRLEASSENHNASSIKFDKLMISENNSTDLNNKSNYQSQMRLGSSLMENSMSQPHMKISAVSDDNNKKNDERTSKHDEKSDLVHHQFISRELKKKLRPLVRQDMTQIIPSKNVLIKFIFFLFIGVTAMIMYNVLENYNEDPFNFANATLELRQKVYGQDGAIDELINFYRENIRNFSVAVLIGGSGVGKSYTSKIIKKHFLDSRNIFLCSPPLKTFKHSISDALSKFYCNLIVLEHLTMNNLFEAVDFIEYLSVQNKNYCVMILTILNPEDIDDFLLRKIDLEESAKQINESFSSIQLPYKIIPFKSLTTDIIDICIKKEAEENNITLTNEQFLQVRNYLLSINSGCKATYAKVQIYSKSHF